MKKTASIKFSAIFLVFAFSFILPQISSAQTASDLQAQINALLAKIQQLQAQLAQIQGTSAQWCHTFNTNLMIGQTGVEITALQTALQKDGESITATNSFDDQTASAITGFQEKYTSDVLAPNGLKHGTGYAGRSTRAKLNSLYGCGAGSTTITTTSTFSITTTYLPNGTVGVSYSASLAGLGGTDWSVSGLPAGLSLSGIVSNSTCSGNSPSILPSCPTTTTITGTPTTAGTYTVTVQLQSGTQTVSKQFSLVVSAQSLACTQEAKQCPDGSYVGRTGSNCAFAACPSSPSCQYKWWFDPSHPTCSYSQFCGTYMYLGLQTFGSQSDCQSHLSASTSPTITALSPSLGSGGTQVTITGSGFTTTGNTVNFGGIYSASASSTSGNTILFTIPSAINACPSNGYSGYATCFGMYLLQPGNYVISVTNANGTSNNASFTVASTTSSAPTITTTYLPNGTVGVSYSASLAGLGGTDWSVSGLPAGLSLSGIVSNSTCSGNSPSILPSCPTTTTITGTPTTAGTYTVTVQLQSGTQTVSKQFSLVVGAAIIPTVTVVSPNGGEQWSMGSTQTINWTMPGDQSYHTEFYLIPQGSTPISNTLIDSAVGGYSIGAQTLSYAASQGNYAWAISPLYPAGTYKIRVYLLPKDSTTFDSSKVLSQDDSDTSFNLVAGVVFDVLHQCGTGPC